MASAVARVPKTLRTKVENNGAMYCCVRLEGCGGTEQAHAPAFVRNVVKG